MSAFESFIHSLQWEMNTPEPYGIWHLVSLLLVVALAAVLVIFFRDAKDSVMRRIIFIGWLVMVILEIYKQVIFAMDVNEGIAVWDYAWYAFPFQFCSSPLYALPFVFLLKDCKLRRFFMTFLSTFSLLAGIAVMLYPNTVFMTYTGINVQTMVHHGLQVAFGVYLFAYNRRQIKWKSLSGGVLVFVGFLVTAMSLNLIVHNIHLAKGMTDDFNMFFISPYFGCELPILSMIRDAVPYPLFLAAYLVAFSLGALLVYVIENGISMFCSRRNAGESA